MPKAPGVTGCGKSPVNAKCQCSMPNAKESWVACCPIESTAPGLAEIGCIRCNEDRESVNYSNELRWQAECFYAGMPPYDIQERAFEFVSSIVTFCHSLTGVHPVTRHLSWQLLDSGTSVGANVEEADAGQ